jgi:hypothetical protein
MKARTAMRAREAIIKQREQGTGQAPERPRHIRVLPPLLRSRPGGIRSRVIARRPEPDNSRVKDEGWWMKIFGI